MDLMSEPRTGPEPPWLTGCRQLVLCPLQGSGIDLPCFRGSAGCSGSICFPSWLSESPALMLTLSTAQPCWDQQEDAGVLCTACWLPALVLRPGTDSTVGMGSWAGLALSETQQHLGIRVVRSASTDFRMAYLGCWQQLQALMGEDCRFQDSQVQSSFHYPKISSQTCLFLATSASMFAPGSFWLLSQDLLL